VLRVGLTGGIACGKSVVRRRLEEEGVPTLDADAVVHRLLGPGTETTREIGRVFGEEMLAADGSVDRKALGQTVFADDEARARLNAIVHPRVYEAIEDFFSRAERRGAPLAVVDAALMVETGSYARYDRVIVVHCAPAQQRARLKKRDGLSTEEAERRIAAQMPIEKKIAYGDELVDTSDTLEETLARTDAVLRKLRAAAGANAPRSPDAPR
jgi:dephospho-CoA kinase